MPSSWGTEQTQFFFELTPDVILDAAELIGVRCTGRCLPLNSMENRVYDLEIEWPHPQPPKSPSELSRIAKFYRPGRWTREQILEEHRFLLDLHELDIPAVRPEKDPRGETLHEIPEIGIYYAVFPKIGGRNPDELSGDQLRSVGRLLARVHNAGATRPAAHRIRLDHETYGWSNLDYLLEAEILPEELEDSYADLVEEICELSAPWFEESAVQRIHGDCHLGNLLWQDQGPCWVDFDDMANGPCVQDLWLLVPGRDEDSREQFNIMLQAYEDLREFDRRSLRLIEPLRALRYVHFSAWIAKRWEDPAFPRRFDFFGTKNYWQQQIGDLGESLDLIREIS